MARLIGVSLAIGAVVGLIGSFVFWWAEGVAEVAGLVVTVLAGVIVAQRYIQKRLLPRLYVEQVRKMIGRGQVPPPESEPVDPPIVAAWSRAIDEGDWDAVSAMLDDDFTVEYPSLDKSFGRDRYLRTMRTQRKRFPPLRYTVDEVRQAPGELWVRSTMNAPQRRGEAITTEWWEVWRVDEAAGRLLGIRQERVLALNAGGNA